MASSTALKVAAGVGGAVVAFKALDSKIHLTHDVKMGMRLKVLKTGLAKLVTDGYNVPKFFADALRKWPDRIAVECDGARFTFADLEAASNRVANWALASGLSRDDCVALNMENRPEYIVTWLGLCKIGCVIAFINTNLVRKPLKHCISVSHAKMVIFGVEVAERVATIADELTAAGVSMFCEGGNCSFAPSLDPMLASSSSMPVSSCITDDIAMSDTFGYIYTSGTTGLPKAAIIKHAKMWAFGALFCNAWCVDFNDRVYCCLPLYHSAGGGLGTGSMLYGGATLVIRRKFSASKFWKEVTDYKCTVVQYIGELCRYLLDAPPSEYDRAHNVRIAIGNGMRPDVWGAFQERFNVPEVGEFYGATEGNTALVNHCTTKEAQGAVGRMGGLLRRVTGIKIVKFDVDEEIPVRGSDGFCIECKAGEPGEMLAPIKADLGSQFQGYTDPKASASKLISDVFVKGDKYFRTGDLLKFDNNGYYFFVDRIGDTFRWKGENVSTTEVAEVVSQYPGVQEVNVYGAQLPGKDGRACMAAMVMADGIDLQGLATHCAQNLPSYAQPLFLRRLPEIEITGTFKHKKVALRRQGVDRSKFTDSVWWLNPATKKYEDLDAAAYAEITSGRAKL